MALIKCPECGSQISDKAPVCPNCGCPAELFQKRTIEDNQTAAEVKQDNSKNNHIGWYVGLIFGIGLLVWYVFPTDITEDDSSAYSYSTESSYSSQNSYSSSSSSSVDETSSTGYSIQFTGVHSVMSYLMGHKFVASNGLILTIKDACLYVNGQCITGAINIENVSASRALITAHSPYSGGNNRMIVDCRNGYIQDCNSNDVYYVQ